ncbi:MAG: ATP-grasp domain-containing protein [Candidatus Wallbacteria bacterium]|nr:ATP-grasp domain-containing protein [Candidatus Wallbacteria bacterium]
MICDNRLILLSDRYISPVLMDYAVRSRIAVFPLKARLKAELAERFPGLHLISDDQAALTAQQPGKFYTNTEDCLSLLVDNSQDRNLVSNIEMCKNKLQFREMLRPLFPDYSFQVVRPGAVSQIRLDKGKNYILKPVRGLFSIGIRRVRNQDELNASISELESEICRYQDISPSVLDSSAFLLEECIDGEEYACDAAFDSSGRPVIYSIMHHPFSGPADFRDVVYYTSRSVMREHLPAVTDFLERITRLISIRNFPVHLEFRLCKGKLFPIEFNPLRFAAIGLSDLPFHAFGFNSFELYMENRIPDWDEILASKDNRFYFTVLGIIPPGRDRDRQELSGFRKSFDDLLYYEEFDPVKAHFSCLAMARTADREKMLQYLNTDFSEFYT